MSLPLSLGFILPHSPSSKASLAAATALSTSLIWARDTSQMACRTNRLRYLRTSHQRASGLKSSTPPEGLHQYSWCPFCLLSPLSILTMPSVGLMVLYVFPPSASTNSPLINSWWGILMVMLLMFFSTWWIKQCIRQQSSRCLLCYQSVTVVLRIQTLPIALT